MIRVADLIFAATISTQDSRFSQNFSTNLGVDEFEVSLTGAQNELRLRVHDSGAGFDLKKTSNGHGLGLISMKERLKLVKGELAIDSRTRSGTTIFATTSLVSVIG